MAAAHTANKNDERLKVQYDTQIRVVKNDFLVIKAALVNEVTNAELMVAIKNNLNDKEDIKDAKARIEKIKPNITSSTSAAFVETEDLKKQIAELEARIPVNEKAINVLKEEVT